jgi:hypothetical protein
MSARPATVRNIAKSVGYIRASEFGGHAADGFPTSGHNALAWTELEDNRSLGTRWASRAFSGLSAPPDPSGDW